MSPAEALDLIAARTPTAPESAEIFRLLAAGGLSDAQAAGLLVAITGCGETEEVLHGAAEALLEAAVPFPRPGYRVADCCGTGGDGSGTVNISTAAMFVISAGGVPVVKHGNHAVSSRCGSTDLLAALDVETGMDPARARAGLDRYGIAYLHAPLYHPAVARLAPVRKALGTRTVFNALGPLLNPARPPIRLVGVYSVSLVLPMAGALARSGCDAGLVVNGDGLDEVALHGPTVAARIRGDEITPLAITPEGAGLERVPIEALRGGGPGENARWMKELLAGRGREEHSAAVAINAGAVLWIAGRASSHREGTAQALEIIRSAAALKKLEELVEIGRGS